jgi:endonuclease YncB( thermonuclease family)
VEDSVTIRPPRRIFKAQSSQLRRSGRFGETVAVGLLGALIGACLVLFAAPADLFGHSTPPYGRLSAEPATLAIVDGETLWLNGSLVRLQGVEAPPRGRFCRKTDASLFDCGAAAVAALAEMTLGRGIVCQLDGRDNSGFPQGMCKAGDVDLNRGMIAAGWAHATSDLKGLRSEEDSARGAHRGIWAGQPSL